jgi:hypothetical protein
MEGTPLKRVKNGKYLKKILVHFNNKFGIHFFKKGLILKNNNSKIMVKK